MTTAQIDKRIEEIKKSGAICAILKTAIRAAANGDYTTAEAAIIKLNPQKSALAAVLNH